MVLKKRLVMAAMAAGVLMASPALATINVYFSPAAQSVDILDGTTTVDILADIPVADEIIGWGLDLTLGGDLNITETGVAIGPDFAAEASVDGDLYSALVPLSTAPLSGNGILLATVTFSLDATGLTTLTLSDDAPSDVTEGFGLFSGPLFAEVVYSAGSVEVVPEPASLALLALGGLAILRRRS